MSLLSVKDLSLSFGGVKAVDGLSLEVEKGSVYAIVGPNGAGKSTIFNMISRIYQPDTGSIDYQGQSLLQVSADQVAQLGIARTFQNLELFDHATVLQNLLLGRHVHSTVGLWKQFFFTPTVRAEEKQHRLKVEEIIDFLDLASYRNHMIAGLPYGVRKKIELARALCVEPQLLLLDEPASGLNPEETEEMGFWIDDIRRDLDITVVMIEHDMSLVAEVSDRVLAVANGSMIAEGSHEYIQSHAEVVKAYLG